MSRKRLNITDQIYGRLLVLVIDWYRTNLTGRTYWFCQCECNTIISVYLANLRSGDIKSCGCYNREKASERCKNRRLDITDQIFGRLQAIVIDWYRTKETGRTYWWCQCECGAIVSVYRGDLRNGHTKSCGCWDREVASKNMSKIGKKYSGENHPNWKGGISSEVEKIRHSLKNKKFILQVFKKANYTCQLSGKKSNGDLQVHHIKGFAKILEENNITTKEQAFECEELWDEKNVIALSEKWHSGIKTDNPNAFHRIYGNNNFTEEDFNEWFEKFKIIKKEDIHANL